jgi:hypothetical protein
MKLVALAAATFALFGAGLGASTKAAPGFCAKNPTHWKCRTTTTPTTAPPPTTSTHPTTSAPPPTTTAPPPTITTPPPTTGEVKANLWVTP